MTRRRTLWLATLLLSVLASATAWGADDDGLRYKFKEGEKLRFVTESKTTVEASGLGEPAKIETTLVFDMTWEVTKVDKDGRATVKSTLDRARFSADTPEGSRASTPRRARSRTTASSRRC